jgi:methionine-rich copper-binding protein CopC
MPRLWLAGERYVREEHRVVLGRWVSCVLLIVSLAIGPLLFAPERVLAHADVESSVPASGSIADAGITTITITFTEEVSLDQSTAELSRDGGVALPGVTSAVDRADRKKMVLTTPPLEPGNYVVTWKAVTEDDNAITSGTITFTVAVQDTPIPTSASTAASTAVSTAAATSTSPPSPIPIPTATAIPTATPPIISMPTATATVTSASAGDGANGTPWLGVILAVAVAIALLGALLVLQRRAAR